MKQLSVDPDDAIDGFVPFPKIKITDRSLKLVKLALELRPANTKKAYQSKQQTCMVGFTERVLQGSASDHHCVLCNNCVF